MLQGEIVVRIIGEDESGSWYEGMFSHPLVATPHGTVIRTGLFHLSDITDDGMKRLLDYEKDVRDAGLPLYGGRLTEEEMNQK